MIIGFTKDNSDQDAMYLDIDGPNSKISFIYGSTIKKVNLT